MNDRTHELRLRGRLQVLLGVAEELRAIDAPASRHAGTHVEIERIRGQLDLLDTSGDVADASGGCRS